MDISTIVRRINSGHFVTLPTHRYPLLDVNAPSPTVEAPRFPHTISLWKLHHKKDNMQDCKDGEAKSFSATPERSFNPAILLDPC
jgi:hypothetical protein